MNLQCLDAKQICLSFCFKGSWYTLLKINMYILLFCKSYSLNVVSLLPPIHAGLVRLPNTYWNTCSIGRLAEYVHYMHLKMGKLQMFKSIQTKSTIPMFVEVARLAWMKWKTIELTTPSYNCANVTYFHKFYISFVTLNRVTY